MSEATMTKRATKASCMAAARKKWGKRAFVAENQSAVTVAERQSRQAKIRDLKAEIAILDEQIKGLGNQWPRLLEAAEFFLAVNGDEPSGCQFRVAVADARRAVEFVETRKAAKEQAEELRSSIVRHRWDAGYIGTINGLGSYAGIQASADSLDELLAQIESKS